MRKKERKKAATTMWGVSADKAREPPEAVGVQTGRQAGRQAGRQGGRG